MKIVCLGDLHLLWDKPIARRDNAHQTQAGKVKFVMDWAVRHRAIVIQPGDFFDTARSWHLTSAYSRFFSEYYDLLTINAVFGQHDTYMYSDRTRSATGLGVLIANDLVKLLTEEPLVIGESHIYGASFGQEIPMVKDKEKLNILAIHKMIVDQKLWPGQEDYIYAEDFLEKHRNYNLIICGDCHRKFYFERKGRIIVNSGPLFRKEADDYNMNKARPGFYVYDTSDQGLEWVEVPHEPADKVLSRAHLDRQEEANEAMEEFISSMSVNDGNFKNVDFVSNLVSFLERNEMEQDVKDILSELMDEEIK